MNKAQILILLILIALVVYYFSQDKSTQKPSNQPFIVSRKPSSLPKKPPVINFPPAQTVSYEYEPAAQPLSPVLPNEIMERNNLSTTNMPLNIPNQEPVYRFPSV